MISDHDVETIKLHLTTNHHLDAVDEALQSAIREVRECQINHDLERQYLFDLYMASGRQTMIEQLSSIRAVMVIFRANHKPVCPACGNTRYTRVPNSVDFGLVTRWYDTMEPCSMCCCHNCGALLEDCTCGDENSGELPL